MDSAGKHGSDLRSTDWTRRALLRAGLVAGLTAGVSAAVGGQLRPVAAAPIVRQSRKSVTAGVGVDFIELDPHLATAQNDLNIQQAVFNALTGLTTDEQIRADLAESWESTDSQTWAIKVRPGVKFHNGREL